MGTLHSTMFRLLLLALCVALFSQCEISVKNVGQVTFTWHIEYAGSNEYENSLAGGEHDNYECTCLPHYMNCLENPDFEVEVTDYAIYINAGNNNVQMCV